MRDPKHIESSHEFRGSEDSDEEMVDEDNVIVQRGDVI